ncbi:MAG: YiiX/YebB-like N1pC/P60 family cysteine hydrolase [Alphaproteobacteria bacterium]
MGTHLFQDAIRTLQASAAGIPSIDDMSVMIEDSRAAERRSYYDPVEDERLREHYARYLGVRVAIWQMILSLRPFFTTKAGNSELSERQIQAFALAFCGAELLVQSGEYLIDLAKHREIVWKKLDEAELRYGIKRKSFTHLYRGLTSTRKMMWFYRACEFYDLHKERIEAALESDDLAPVRKILGDLNRPAVSRGDHLRRYSRFLKFSLRRRRLSTGRKIMFALFETTGSDIAELTIPLAKNPELGKRVTEETVSQVLTMLQPGDVFITRHDDAMSNLFLPGFWPHAALYIGTPNARKALGVRDVSDGFKHSGEDVHFLESKKDGVLLRPALETLQVDAFVVLRPKLSPDDIAAALNRALSHAGKLYDFIFDFSAADRLVCTEVIYRAYHGIGGINFDLSTKAGRKCLSAEDFLNQGLGQDMFELVAAYGLEGNELVTGQTARTKLARSFESVFPAQT